MYPCFWLWITRDLLISSLCLLFLQDAGATHGSVTSRNTYFIKATLLISDRYALFFIHADLADEQSWPDGDNAHFYSPRTSTALSRFSHCGCPSLSLYLGFWWSGSESAHTSGRYGPDNAYGFCSHCHLQANEIEFPFLKSLHPRRMIIILGGSSETFALIWRSTRLSHLSNLYWP